MRLINKIFTTIAPIAVVGIVIPVSVSCGCGGNAYDIEYGSDINCKDEKAENYHSLEDVKKSIVNHVDKENGHIISSEELEEIQSIPFSSEKGTESAYYDLIASFVMHDDTLMLSSWHTYKTDLNEYTFSFTLNGENFGTSQDDAVSIRYDNTVEDSQHIYLTVSDASGTKKQFRSYVYYDCTFEQ